MFNTCYQSTHVDFFSLLGSSPMPTAFAFSVMPILSLENGRRFQKFYEIILHRANGVQAVSFACFKFISFKMITNTAPTAAKQPSIENFNR